MELITRISSKESYFYGIIYYIIPLLLVGNFCNYSIPFSVRSYLLFLVKSRIFAFLASLKHLGYFIKREVMLALYVNYRARFINVF